MHRACEQATLCNGGFGAYDFCLFIKCDDIVFLFKDSKKLLRAFCNRERAEVSFFCFVNNGFAIFICEINLIVLYLGDTRTVCDRLFPVSSYFSMSKFLCPVRQTEYSRAKWDNREQIERVTYVYGIAV